MIPGEKEVRYYITKAGKAPCEEWILNLRDQQGRSAILARIRRFGLGNPGKWRPVGQGVSELKIDVGPGYRVYFGEDGKTLVILLCGGDKKSQKKDIKVAHTYWTDYRSRK